MERSDGKNPFDHETYNRPAASIKTMLELRAFCADFFDKHIRTSVSTDEGDVASFLTLITHSSNFFARARAVIPELQAPDVLSSHPNENVQVLLHATRHVRGPPGKQWEFLPEEPAWTKLAKDGMENLTRDLANDGVDHKKQPSDAIMSASPVNPTVLVPGQAEYRSSDTLVRAPASVRVEPEPLPKKLDLSAIPTFVPRNAMGPEELVWSPTSGTRPRRPDEVYRQSTAAGPVSPMQLGHQTPPNVGSAYSIKNQYLFHGSRDLSDTPIKDHRHSDSLRMTPPPQFKSTQSPLNPSSRSQENANPRPKRRHNLQEMPCPGSIDRMMEMATIKHDPDGRDWPPSYSVTRSYPVNNLSRTGSPSRFKGPPYTPNQARSVYGAEPFSAPPNLPSYENIHPAMYGGPPSSYHGQPSPYQSGLDAASFHPFASQPPYVPSPEIWTAHSPRARHGAQPDRTIHPPALETLSVPPPGSMPPLDYWNMLHQRETEIRTRLEHANRPMTEPEHRYLSLLADARVAAAATQMPARGGMAKGKWLAELGRTLRSIWKTGPGTSGFSPVVVARKVDFETAVAREIELTAREKKKHGGVVVDRAYGA